MTIFKRILKIAGIVLASVLALCIIVFVSIFVYFDVIMPKSKTQIDEHVSSDGKHTLTTYQSASFFPPTSTIVTVSGSWIIGQRKIYSIDQADNVVIVWIDDHTVNVNGAILNIYFDRYWDHAEDSDDD